MSDEKKQKKATPSAPADQTLSDGLNSELITSVLTDLNIARKSTFLYPLDHDQVKQSTFRAGTRLESIFAITPEFKIGVAADTLLSSGKTLDPLNPTHNELAGILTRQGIIVLSFLKGITADELAIFLSTLAKSSDDIHAEGGLINYLQKKGVTHVQVTLIDYESFNITDESEIIRNNTDYNREAPKNIWHDLAAQLLDNSSQQPRQNIEPHNIAMLLNLQPEKTKSALDQFEKIVDKYLQKQESPQTIPKGSESISAINALLNDLNPDLRRQFLTSTLNRCDQSPQSQETQDFISKLSDNIVVEMLQQVNQMDIRISESLMHLIEQIYPTIDDKKVKKPFEVPNKLSSTQKEQFQELFKPEAYENFVPENYNHILKQLGRSPTPDSDIKIENSALLKELNNLNQPQLDQHILKALGSLMANCESTEEYKTYALKIVEMAMQCLYHKDFSTVYEAITIFNDHMNSMESENIRNTARAALDKLYSPKTMNEIIQTLHQPSSKLPPAIAQLLEAIGPKIIPALVDMFMQGSYGEKQASILTILKQYKKESVAAAHKLVHRNDIEQTKKMIFLIRQLDDRASSAYLRSLVAHTNTDISREALTALLHFNDHWSIFFLRDKLNSDNPDELSQAIAIAGNFRNKAMVPDLTARLKFNALSKTDIKRNADIVSALGKIGDTAAIPHLAKLAQSAWSIYRSNLKELKLLIFQTLKGYPAKEIAPLLEIGRRAKDQAIQQICNQLSADK